MHDGASMQPGERPLSAFVSSVMRPELQWARDAAVEALTSSPFLTPWAFEYTPIASNAAESTYLRKVREADVVIWLVGEETTEPVRNEIAEALASDRRVWVVRLPATARSAQTSELLAEVGSRVKWGDASNPDELRELLALTLTDEVIRALRETPGLTRLALLEQLGRASRARMVVRWQAPGLSRAEAISFADDASVGTPPSGALPSEEKRLRIVVGDVGAGKSVVAERALQSAIVRAREAVNAPVPVFLHARECVDSLEQRVRLAAEGLGDPRIQGAFVVVDGLDEVAESAAQPLVDAARILVDAFPATQVVVTSRPIPAVREAPERVNLPPLDHQETRDLIGRVVGADATRGLGIHWPRALEPSIHRPLFAILFALDWREREPGTTTTGRLLASLVEKAVDRDRASAAITQLQRLAVLATDRDGRMVAAAEVGGLADRSAIAGSRLVVQDEERVGFALPIFAQWFAAQSLQAGTPTPTELTSEPRRLTRWRYALAIAIATGATEFVDNLLETLVRADAAFAAEVLDESFARWATEEPQERPDALTAGRHLRRAFLAWQEGIAPLDKILLPLDEHGRLAPLAVATGDWLWTGWHDERESDEDVVPFPEGFRAMDELPGWQMRRGGVWNAEKGWAWNWSLGELRNDLTRKVKAHAFPVSNNDLTDEALWLFGLQRLGRGSFAVDPIHIEEMAQVVRQLPIDAAVKLTDRTVEVAELVRRLDERLRDDQDELLPPWPESDLARVGGWIWKPYSPEAQLERARAIYSAAIVAYEEIVNRWFGGLRNRMLTAATLPATLIGEFRPSRGEEFRDGPVLNWHWEALPSGEQSKVVFTLATDEPDGRDYDEILEEQRAVHERLLQLRPESAGWITTIYSGTEAGHVFHSAPLAGVVYGWIANDLKRIKWMS